MGWSKWEKNLAIMWMAQLVGMSAITGVVSFIPLYVAQLGVTSIAEVELWSGLIMGVAPLCAAFFGPYWGALADQHGRKIMLAKVMLAFGSVMMAMAYVNNVYQLFALRTLQGIFGGSTAAGLALVTSLTPEHKMGYALGIFQTAIIGGSAIGPLFGGLVADYFGFRYAFMLFSVLCFLSFFIIYFCVTENFTPTLRVTKSSIVSESWNILAIPGMKGMLFIQFLSQFAIQIIAPVLPLYIQDIAGDTTRVASYTGAIIAVTGVTSALASVAIGRISQRFSYRMILCVGGLFAGIFFAAQALVNSIMMLGVMRGASGFCMGAMLPVSNALVAMLIPPEKRGVAYGVTNGAALLGNVLGPLSGGTLALLLGIPYVFWCTAILFVLVAGWSLFVLKIDNYKAQQTVE